MVKKILIFILHMQGLLLMSCSNDPVTAPVDYFPFNSTITGRWIPVEAEINGNFYSYPSAACNRVYYEFNDNSTYRKAQFINCRELPGTILYYKINGTTLTLGYGTPHSYDVEIQDRTATNLVLLSREDHIGDGSLVIKTRYSRDPY